MIVRVRVLSGIHKDAELDLTPGDWSVGSDALCDILLSDVAAQQAVLRVGADGSVLVLPGEGEGGEAEVLPYYAPLEWGAVRIAVGPPDVPWPVVEAPGESAEAQPRHPADAEEHPLTMNSTVIKAGPAGNAAQNTPGFESKGGIFGYAGRTKAGVWFSPARVVLLLLLLILTAGGVWKWAAPDTPQQRRENIEAVLRAEGLKVSAFEVDERMGAWTVRGVVADNNKLQDVSAALRGLGLVLHTDILSRQAVAEALEARIQAEGARLSVTLRGDTLRLAGYAYDAKSLRTLLQPLEADCQRAGLRQDVIFWQELQQPLKDSLAALKLQERVRLTPGPYSIAVDTTALALGSGGPQQDALRSLEREVTDMTRGISPLVRPVSATAVNTSPKPQPPSSASRPPLRAGLCEQLRITPGGASSAGGALLVTFDGRDYGPGAQLPNGMQVQEVRPEYVTLVQGERLVYCPAR